VGHHQAELVAGRVHCYKSRRDLQSKIAHMTPSLFADRQRLSSGIAMTIDWPMGTKAQHRQAYRRIPGFLRRLREEAGLTQRKIGAILKRPQSWVYDCETGNRRVDICEFCEWCRACDAEPANSVLCLEREG